MNGNADADGGGEGGRVLVNLFELRTRILDGSLEPENAQVEEYSSLEELVSHGWVGD